MCLLIVVSAITCTGFAEETAKFPAFPNSSDFDSASSLDDVFTAISGGANWRSQHSLASGIFGAESTNKCVNFSFGSGNSYFDFSETAYLTVDDEDLNVIGTTVEISYKMAVKSKNFDVAGLWVGQGLGQYISTYASVDATDSSSYGMVGMTPDGIYAFGEKLMDYDAGVWYDFDVVIYGGST